MEPKTSTVTYVTVKNRDNGYTSYILPNGVKRQFTIGQTRKIDLDELKELKDCDGGEYILKNYLIINDKSALDYLDLNPEPEYFYTEVEIKKLLAEGSLDQLDDALTFAPAGVIDLIKDIAIKSELPDMRKRKLIFEKTGFSVDNAIKVNEILADDGEKAAEPAEAPKRKAATIETTSSGRKAAPIATETTTTEATPKKKYNVIVE